MTKNISHHADDATASPQTELAPADTTQERGRAVNPDFISCEQCGRQFSSAFGLRMHQIRKHEGREWNRSGRKKKTGKKARRHIIPAERVKPLVVETTQEQQLAHVPNFCPVCGFAGLRAIFLAMNFKK